jgi:hypothetical protein
VSVSGTTMLFVVLQESSTSRTMMMLMVLLAAWQGQGFAFVMRHFEVEQTMTHTIRSWRRRRSCSTLSCIVDMRQGLVGEQSVGRWAWGSWCVMFRRSVVGELA